MDAIKGILAEYYWIFLIVGILVLVTLIGFISSVKKKAKEQQPQVAEENSQETQPVAQPEIPQPTGATLDLTPVQPQQPYVEPSLDGLASSATEVKLGFDTNEQSSSIFENEGPMLVIEDHSASQAQPVAMESQQSAVQPQVVEPVAQPMEQEFGLVIEDPAAQTVAQVQPVVQPQPVVAQPQVVEPAAQPMEQEFGLVIEDPATQTAAPVQPMVQPQPVPVAQVAPVQQQVAQPMPAQQPVQQPASIFETDAPTLVIPDPSANQ